jgi:hypothetical protein
VEHLLILAVHLLEALAEKSDQGHRYLLRKVVARLI